MNRACFAIPGRLNLVIAAFSFGRAVLDPVGSWTGPPVGIRFFLLSLAYGIVMNSGYAMLHEAEHNLLHPNPIVKSILGSSAGAVLSGALFT